MPRTKQVKKSNVQKLVKNEEFFEQYKKIIHETINAEKEKDLAILDEIETRAIHLLDTNIRQLTKTQLSKTIYEMKNSASSFMNSTKRTRSSSRCGKRSMSYTEDEGYLTTGSSEGRRTSRSRQRAAPEPQKSKRKSRSLSRSNMTQQHKPLKSVRTPTSRCKPPTTFGTITPKVKSYTHQVLLRRPKQGEVAVSLQGSPLMVSSVVMEQMANVNIPLPDGSYLSLQPQRGLRISQIPQLDPETEVQIQALSDNLNKMKAIFKRK